MHRDEVGFIQYRTYKSHLPLNNIFFEVLDSISGRSCTWELNEEDHFINEYNQRWFCC
jgi:hypothetical protein